ncbi:protein EXECUTER 2, chloroplastic [Brassica napus]|uniref:protein EXECUTER 2, chloroplastic n=1 Tax=Brassica napus TaxID=3708 RepID=UPI0006AB549C|nr:protein EXECUTER 2, chloroplastic [Brassica napus]
MATTHPCLVGQRISVPQFHLLFNSKPPNHELSTNKRSNFCVSIGLPHSFASPLSTRNPKKSPLTCLRNCAAVDGPETSSSEDKWDWDRWSRHFSEIEETDGVVSLLKVQLEEAIEREDFEEAAKLKAAIGEATVSDSVAEIMCQLQDAIREERYHDASKLCRQTGSGLVGWWVCYPQDSEEPFGRIVRITPGVGRFIGKSYSPRQLVTAAAGTPLFEIFVVKDTDGGYVMQVVYLQHGKQKPSVPESSYVSSQQSSNASAESPSIIDAGGSEVKADKKKDKLLNAEEPTEERIQNVIKFLKDKIPGLKLMKVMDVELPDEEIIGSDDDLVELVGEVIEEAGSADDEEDDDSIEESADNGKDLNPKVFIGGVLHSTEDSSIDDELVRVTADITDNERDSFTLHVPGRRKSDVDTRKDRVSKEQVTALAAQGLSDLMPPEVAKAFWGSERPSLKVSRNVREIVKLAISQAQKGNRLSEYTTFNRITTPESDLDPFDGLYVGAFGPYGTEIVQLKRKYGNWNDAEESDSSDIEFFEYVEAVKLTGDPNVPAGQVTFRARIGKGSRMRDRGMYPEEMGVLASYMGEGRIADFGFKNPRWVGGQLLKLNGKGMGPYVTGGDLGFLYIGPEKSFMVVFNRLRLPE